MPAQLEEVVASFVREKYRAGDFVIGEVNGNGNGNFFVKVYAEEGELDSGLSYRFMGRWEENMKYGRQFKASTFIKVTPHGRHGTIKYLQQAPGIGPATAKALWDCYKGEAVRIVRETPEAAASEIGGQFTAERAAEASAYLIEQQALESCSIDLMDLLEGRGFPKTTAKRAVKEWGNRAAAIIRRNPYLLMHFRGCGFLRTDQMYLDLGGNPERLKRQALCGWYAIARDTNGHTWFHKDYLCEGLKERIAGTAVRAVDAVKLAKRGRILCTYRDENNQLWLSEGKKARNEAYVAEKVATMMRSPGVWPSLASLDISDHQRQQLFAALQACIGCFTGAPGTGKTYVTARLIGKLIERHGVDQVAVCAPTGKAAVRISEVMQSYGVMIRARTIHSMLGIGATSTVDGWAFQHDENNPIKYRYIFADESSMIDTDLMASLLRACATGTHVIFVGDIGQLPPVGHGAPLRDFIAAGVPTGELREIQRNAGQIVRACHDIRDGKQFQVCAKLDPDAGDNLKVITTADGDESLRRIVEAIHKLGKTGQVDPVWDVQVVCAVNEKSPLCRKDLNKTLQLELNPGSEQAFGNPFRVGDKIVCTKNGFLPAVDEVDEGNEEQDADGRVFVANGELGKVLAVYEKLTVARFESPLRTVKIPRGGGENGDESTGCSFELGYAISVHKSQGSEWPVVIVALDEYAGARMICDRGWLYTAISRARRVCLLIGKLQTAWAFCQHAKINGRKTFLAELIRKHGHGE